MANELTYNFPLKSDAYAAFDAMSLRNLIIERLNDQGLITDQNYIGSNLASIIDIVSYSFNTLIYYLNKTSNESMFTEAQLYENINKIVKILNYKPIGYQTSTLSFNCSTKSNAFKQGVYTIPRYSYIVAGGVPFSFNEDITFTVLQDNVQLDLADISNKKLLFQGIFQENAIHVAAGDKNETVTINVKDILIDHFNIHVYVYERKYNRWFQYQEATDVQNYTSSVRVFEKRINPNFLYEITFGDGVNGNKLETGDRVAIYYLKSSGENGVIGPNLLNRSVPAVYSTSLYNEILKDVNEENYIFLTTNDFAKLQFDNAVGSTSPKLEEGPDDIRKNAPSYFKKQLRLVTLEDYESYIRSNFANFISDVKVFSNWDYTGKYLKYFYDINLNPGGFKQVALNQVLYADSCNFNNIYVCAMPRVSKGSTLKYLLPSQKELIISNVSVLKTISTEVTFMDPLFKSISFGTLKDNQTTISPSNTHQLELIRSQSSVRSLRSIQQDAITIFKNYFDLSNSKLGQTIEYSTLVTKLMSISGVSRIVTRNTEDNSFFDGLSFFLWNPLYPELDKQTLFNNHTLREFELLYFENLATIDLKIIAKASL
jgi:hypothetical protein